MLDYAATHLLRRLPGRGCAAYRIACPPGSCEGTGRVADSGEAVPVRRLARDKSRLLSPGVDGRVGIDADDHRAFGKRLLGVCERGPGSARLGLRGDRDPSRRRAAVSSNP
jgi:hypothetical protein